MAKFAKISSVAPRPITAPQTTDYNALVEKMINQMNVWLDDVLCDKPDLIVLPEACDRYANLGGAARDAYYECRGDRVRDALCDTARKNNCYIAYSAFRNTPWDSMYPMRNSTQIIGRDGSIVGIYDKNHLVITENTEDRMAYGTEAKTFKLDFANAACAICFDLNFTELMKKYVPQKPNLIIFSSMYHGGLMQEYWASGCRAYFASSVAGLESGVLDPFGRPVGLTTNYYHYATAKVNFDYRMAHIDYNRPRFVAAKKKHGDALTVTEPGHAGYVMLTCEDESMCVDDIVKEFEIELLDDYFERSLKHRREHL